MNNIFKNSLTLFIRNKEYFSAIVLTPILMLLIFSFILSFQSKVNIAFVNEDNGKFGELIESKIKDMDFLNPITDSDDIKQDIINGKIEFAVVVNKNSSIRIIKSKNSNLADFVGTVLNSNIQSFVSGNSNNITLSENHVKPKGVPITNALGLIIFKMIGAASILATLIITEKKNGIVNRIYMSRTKISTYLFGRGSMFFLNLLLFSFIYFITAKLFHFDFAMKHPIKILVVFAVLGIFTTALALLLAAFVNDETTVWNFLVLVLLPTSILSGALFPFSAMPEALQSIGNIFPQRWITLAIEKLQNGGELLNAAPQLLLVLALSIIMFMVANIPFKKSRS